VELAAPAKAYDQYSATFDLIASGSQRELRRDNRGATLPCQHVFQ
jgi:hypothetical protein